MQSDVGRSQECLESCLLAWRELAEAIQRCCASIVKMDLEGVYRQIARQEDLCAKIRKLTAERCACEHAEHTPTGSPFPPRAGLGRSGVAEHARLLENELPVAQHQVRQWNRMLKILLARSSRTINMRANALVNQFATYPPPRSGRTCASL